MPVTAPNLLIGVRARRFAPDQPQRLRHREPALSPSEMDGKGKHDRRRADQRLLPEIWSLLLLTLVNVPGPDFCD